MKTKQRDCVEMKHQAAAELGAKLEAMNTDERRRFWEDLHSATLKKQAELRATESAQPEPVVSSKP